MFGQRDHVLPCSRPGRRGTLRMSAAAAPAEDVQIWGERRQFPDRPLDRLGQGRTLAKRHRRFITDGKGAPIAIGRLADCIVLSA